MQRLRAGSDRTFGDFCGGTRFALGAPMKLGNQLLGGVGICASVAFFAFGARAQEAVAPPPPGAAASFDEAPRAAPAGSTGAASARAASSTAALPAPPVAPNAASTPVSGWLPNEARLTRTTTMRSGGGVTTTGEEYLYAGESPEFISWHPNRPELDGYHLEERYRNGVLIPGAVITGMFYGLALLTAISGESEEALAVPLAGPFIQMADESDSDTRFLLAFDGMAQIAGTTLLTIALTHRKKWLVRNDAASLVVAPAPTGGKGIGLAAVGRF